MGMINAITNIRHDNTMTYLFIRFTLVSFEVSEPYVISTGIERYGSGAVYGHFGV
jgi:hypothetical protein